MLISEGKYSGFRGAVALAHFFLRERVQPGDRVADATCGNGHDTLFLARLVGPDGRVWAFDVQEGALSATRTILGEAGCLEQVEMVAAGHERLSEYVLEPLKAAVFNLGYLPGGDKQFITRPENTVAALQKAADLLLPGGIIAICVYTGHPCGPAEGAAVERWGASLDPRRFNVWVSQQANRPESAPYLVLVDKAC